MIAATNNHSLNERQGRISFQEDDRRVFTAVQLERYLKRKVVKRFCSQIERDVILEIIADSWKEIEKSLELSQMDTDGKIRAFYHITVVFPGFVAEDETVIPVDFRKKTRIKGHDCCFCGSGHSYETCCGAILSVEELLFGPK